MTCSNFLPSMENRFSRPQRHRRHSRRAWSSHDDILHPRPLKRLFTPEIKRMLKDWLIRRRENPYPSRDEKKRLAIETGLTYTQICNWFANWRRKLKNSESEKVKKSWGHLIKNYNINAKGNVEQFSISSEDSIWEEENKLKRCCDERQIDDDDDGNDVGFDDGNDGDADVEADEDYTESEKEEMDYNDRRNRSPTSMPVLHFTHTPRFSMETGEVNSIDHRDHRGHHDCNHYADQYISSFDAKADCFQVNCTTCENNFVEIFNKSKAPQQQQLEWQKKQCQESLQSQENLQLQQQQQQEQQQQQQLRPKFSSNIHRTKYKQQMMEKYLRDIHEKDYITDKNDNNNKNNGISNGNIMKLNTSLSNTPYTCDGTDEPSGSTKTELSKWLESAAKFRPNKNNYFIEWNRKRNKLERKMSRRSSLSIIHQQSAPNGIKPTTESPNPMDENNHLNKEQQQQQQLPLIYNTIHHKDELDAAEALANLAFNCRQRIFNSNIFPNSPLST